MKKILFLFLATSLAFSCEYEELLDEELNLAIADSWLQVEYGLSPGGGYYTVPVPADPPKTITFKGDFTMSSTNMGLDKYEHFRIVEDTLRSQQVIAFFEDDPGNKHLDLVGLSPTYIISLEENHLTLYYRWCIEGCHMKFKRIASVERE